MGLFDETPQYQQPVYTPLTDPNRRKQRVLIFTIVGGLLLLIIIGIVNSIRAGSGPQFDYAKLAAQHDELLRLVQEHEDKAKSLDTQNYMSRAESILLTGKTDWTDFLASRYQISVSGEDTALATNEDVDERLEASDIANRFDDDFAAEYAVQVEKAVRQTNRLLENAASEANKLILSNSLAIYESL